MNVLKDTNLAVTAPNAPIYPEHMNVSVHQITTAIHTMEYAHHHKYGASVMVNVDQMKNVFNQENVSVLHRFTQIHKTTTNAKVHVNVSLVELTQSAPQVIHQNVFVIPALKEILCKDAAMLMNALTIHAHMVLIV